MTSEQKRRAQIQLKLAKIMKEIHPEISYIGVIDPVSKNETRVKVPKNKDQK